MDGPEDTGGERSWILHVDLDQFLAAVEVRRRPELAGRPIVVGGDGDPTRPRQVVATASYEARAFGVHSGLPLVTALRRCPDAVFLASDRAAYDEASDEVMAVLRSSGHPLEVWGWDEAVVGVRTADPEAVALDLKAKVLAETGLSCAVGIGDTKLQAKTATGFAKPGGVHRLTRATWLDVMGDQPVTAINGIGKRIATRLAEHGIATVADLAHSDHEALAVSFGPTIGPNLRLMGLGGGDAPVDPTPYVPRGRSKEETFRTDVRDTAELHAHAARLARDLTASVTAEGRRVTHVAAKVRTNTFFTRTSIGKLPEPTTDPDVVERQAHKVLDRLDLDHPIRLLGIRVVLEMPT